MEKAGFTNFWEQNGYTIDAAIRLLASLLKRSNTNTPAMVNPRKSPNQSPIAP
jgi:hypothetical protein